MQLTFGTVIQSQHFSSVEIFKKSFYFLLLSSYMSWKHYELFVTEMNISSGTLGAISVNHGILQHDELKDSPPPATERCGKLWQGGKNSSPPVNNVYFRYAVTLEENST